MATSLGRLTRKCFAETKRIHLAQTRGHKFRTKNPRQKPIQKRVFEEIMKPIYPKESKPYLKGSCLDPLVRREDEVNPYEEFLVRQLEQQVWSSKMFIICHQLPINQIRLSELKKDYIVHDIRLAPLNNKHMLRIIKDTKLANLEPLLKDTNIQICCTEPKVKEVLAPLRKYPELIILGGYVSGRLVTQHQFKDLAKLPPLDRALGELVSILNMAAGGTTLSLLNSHQQKLSSSLEQYRKQLGEPNKE